MFARKAENEGSYQTFEAFQRSGRAPGPGETGQTLLEGALANYFDQSNLSSGVEPAEFAVNAIRMWWLTMGKIRFSDATELLICADGGGSNGHRVRSWKTNLAVLAKETGLMRVMASFGPT